MKNKMFLPALGAWTKTFLIILSLFQTGVVWAFAHVESRSSSGSSSYANQSLQAEQNAALDTMQKIEYLQREMQELRGKVEEQTYQMQQMQEQHKKLYMDLDKRLRENGTAKTAAATTDGVTFTENAPSGIQNTGAINSDLNAHPEPQRTFAPAPINNGSADTTFNDEKAYQDAYRLVQSKDFDGALRAFTTMLEQSPQGKYAPNAQYWLGEIYLTKGNLEKASAAFTVVYRQHPQHPKAADSLLKLGYVEYNKGQWKKCQEFLNQVKAQFPGTTSAQLADSRLQRLQQEGHI